MTELVLKEADTKEQRFAFLLRMWMAMENISAAEIARRLTDAGFQTSTKTATRWVNGTYKRLPAGLTYFLAIISDLPKEYWEVDKEGEPVVISRDGLKIRFTLK